MEADEDQASRSNLCQVCTMTEETLFTAALEKGKGAERATFLDVACAGDAAMRRRVEALLGSHEQAGFLMMPAVQCAAELLGGEGISGQFDTGRTRSDDAVCAPAFAEGLGTQIGRYKLLEQIGEGGMGTVWMAQQVEPVNRLVAVKLIKQGWTRSKSSPASRPSARPWR